MGLLFMLAVPVPMCGTCMYLSVFHFHTTTFVGFSWIPWKILCVQKFVSGRSHSGQLMENLVNACLAK